MKKENVYDKVARANLVLARYFPDGNVRGVRSADTGIVALSLALSPNMKDKGRYFEIPSADYPHRASLRNPQVIPAERCGESVSRLIKRRLSPALFTACGFAVCGCIHISLTGSNK